MQTRPLFEVKNPAGIWRCTHSTFDDFVVGQEYPCLPENNGGYRIYPQLYRNAWSPYWEAHRARFCYRKDELDFVFVRSLPTSEIRALIRHRDETPGPTYPHISFPLEFVEDEPKALPRRRRASTLARLMRSHARDTALVLAGAAAATIVCLSI